jgi:hypothetical protein
VRTCRHPARQQPTSAVARRRACASLVASVAAGVPLWNAGATAAGFCAKGFGVRASVGRVATNASRFPPRDPSSRGWSANGDVRLTSACASPPSIAMRPARCGGFVDERSRASS